MGQIYNLDDFRSLPPVWTFQAQHSPSGCCPNCQRPDHLENTRRSWQEPETFVRTASHAALSTPVTVYVQCRCRQVYWRQVGSR